MYFEEGSLTIAELISRSFNTAKEKGWWDTPRNQAECIALMHSELSEALESLRRGEPMLYMATDTEGHQKPEGLAAELADLLIRVADFCGGFNVPLEDALYAKLKYNESRPYKHGCKF